MTFLAIILIGGIIGWLASIVLRTGAERGYFLNIVIGIAGALLAGLALGEPAEITGMFDTRALFAACLGAIALLAAVTLARREAAR